MIVALTGVTGHLGAAVLRELHRRNYEIKVLVRGEDLRSIGNIPVEIIKGDVLHPESLHNLMQGSPGECYVLSGKWVSLREIVSMLSESTGNRMRVFTIPPVIAKAGLPVARLQGWIGRKEPLYTHEVLEAILTENKCISSKKAMRDLN